MPSLVQFDLPPPSGSGIAEAPSAAKGAPHDFAEDQQWHFELSQLKRRFGSTVLDASAFERVRVTADRAGGGGAEQCRMANKRAGIQSINGIISDRTKTIPKSFAIGIDMHDRFQSWRLSKNEWKMFFQDQEESISSPKTGKCVVDAGGGRCSPCVCASHHLHVHTADGG
jgi:hypothetical protein